MRNAWWLAGVFALVGCESTQHYQTRGLVRGHEGVGDDERLAVHHEKIVDFEDRDGKRAPMPSMTMIFGLRPGLRGQTFSPGTKLRFQFDVQWDVSPFLVITQIERLPADSPLELRDAHAHP